MFCPRAEHPFVFLSEEDKRRLCLNNDNFWSRHSPNFRTSQCCFLSSNWFFLVWVCLLIDKPMVIKKLTIASMWLLGLGSKLYARNMPPMLDKTLHDVHAESRVHQNWISQTKVLLAGWSFVNISWKSIASANRSFSSDSGQIYISKEFLRYKRRGKIVHVPSDGEQWEMGYYHSYWLNFF